MSGTDVLGDLKGVIEKLQDYAGRDQALREAYLEVGTAVADVLALLEKSGPDTARAIADALKGVKLTAEVRASDVIVNVNPTPVEVNVKPSFNVPAAPAPIVQMMPGEKGGGWDFDFTEKNGVITGCKARRI